MISVVSKYYDHVLTQLIKLVSLVVFCKILEMNLNLRDATLGDVHPITEIFNAAILADLGLYFEKPVTLENRRIYLQSRFDLGLPVFVIEDKNECGVILAFGTYGPFRSTPCTAMTMEHSIYVREGYRGIGLGRRMMDALITKAKSSGVSMLVATIDASNTSSIKFHLKYDFVETGRLPRLGIKNGHSLTMVIMQLALDEPPITN